MTDEPLFSSPHGLYACQQEGVAFGYTTSGLLVADTGLGKSVMAMAIAALLQQDGIADLFVLVCKNNKLTEWEEDFTNFTSMSHRIHHGPSRMRQLHNHQIPNVLISTFETLRTDLTKFAVPAGKRAKRAEDGPLLQALLEAQSHNRRVAFIYDEISDKLRNRSSALYKAHAHALKRLRIAQPDMRVLGLTATPLSKGYEDGFNVLRQIVPHAMPTVADFDRVVIKSRDDYGRPRYDREGAEIFVRLCAPYIWRRRKTDPDVREMFPAKIEEWRTIRMGEAQAALYRSLAKLQEGEDKPVPGLNMVLRQVAAYPASLVHSAYYGDSELAQKVVVAVGEDTLRSVPSAKAEVLVSYLSPIIHSQGDKAVVFSFFGPSVLPLLADDLRKEGIRSYLYHADMSGPEREDARRAFRADPDPCVFLTSDAGKDGINLPEASYVIEYESALSFDTRTQRFGRIDRLTSTNPSITCTTFVLQDTVEERLVENMLARNEMSDHFVGDIGADGHVGAQQRRTALFLAS